jgi:hypothetical protein
MARARRFDPTGDYVRRYVPELAILRPARIHTPWTQSVKGYPDPRASSERAGTVAPRIVRTDFLCFVRTVRDATGGQEDGGIRTVLMI